MKGKSIISILIGIVLIIVGCILLFGGSGEETTDNDTNTNTNVPADTNTPVVQARIFVYDQTGTNVINTIEITDAVKGNELQGYVNQLRPLTGEEIVNKKIVKNTEIKYGNNITITVQTDEERYCEYSSDGGITTNMSYMPIGLVNWLKQNAL